MVLNKFLVYIVLVFGLVGCSVLSNTSQQPESIVPAYSDPDEQQIDTQSEAVLNDEPIEIIKMNSQRSPYLDSTAKEAKQKDLNKKSPPISSRSELPYPLIVQSLIERAEKAIRMQQWLRAQHILEQGLHIAPNNAKVFLIYGDVYLNLGILAQAEQMYRRSIALAGDQSPIGRLAITKLEALKTGN